MLIDRHMPDYQFREFHHIPLQGAQEAVFGAVRNLDFSDSYVIRGLFKARGLPTKDLSLLGFVEQADFTLLGEEPNKEILFGFYGNKKIEKVSDVEEFAQCERYPLKMTWNFHIEQRGDDAMRLSTETRAWCRSGLVRTAFTPYWYAVRPFSGLIRRIMLAKIRQACDESHTKL